MRITVTSVFLRVGLAALAMPLAALNTGSSPAPQSDHHAAPGKHVTSTRGPAKSANSTRGEADRLQIQEANATAEERDAREDNRGRLTSTSQHARATKPVVNTVYHGNKAATASHRAPQPRGATLQTGQFVTRPNSRLATRDTALHNEIGSAHAQNRKLAGEPAPTTDPQNANTLHLKKHNARMF